MKKVQGTNPENDRRGFIGGSDVAAVLGVSPWKSAYALWEEKHLGLVEEFNAQRQAVLDWGKRLEPYVIDELEQNHDMMMVHRNRVIVGNVEHEGREAPARAEIDFECFYEGDDLTNGDVKTASIHGKDGWGASGTDEVPTYYTAQFQWGMMMTGAASCICAVLFGANDLRLYRIQRDDAIIAYLKASVVAFWNDHVLTGEPPAIVDGDDAERHLNRFSGVTLTATDEIRGWLTQLSDVKAQQKAVETVREELELKLKASLASGYGVADMSSHNAAIVDDAGKALLTWNPQSAKRLDVGAVKERAPDLYAECLATSTFRVLRLKDKNL
jgi:putative phage-type endonuclease